MTVLVEFIVVMEVAGVAELLGIDEAFLKSAR